MRLTKEQRYQVCAFFMYNEFLMALSQRSCSLVYIRIAIVFSKYISALSFGLRIPCILLSLLD